MAGGKQYKALTDLVVGGKAQKRGSTFSASDEAVVHALAARLVVEAPAKRKATKAGKGKSSRRDHGADPLWRGVESLHLDHDPGEAELEQIADKYLKRNCEVRPTVRVASRSPFLRTGSRIPARSARRRGGDKP